MNLLRSKPVGIAALLLLGLATIACQPTRAAFVITNDTDQDIDFIYAEDFIDLSDFGRDYNSLQIGDRDTYQGCTRCDMKPGDEYRFEEPFSRGQTVIMAARVAESDRMLFIQRYTWKELLDLDWEVSIVNQGGR